MLAAPSIGCAFANCSVACSGEHVDVAFPFDARVKGNVACGLARMRPVHFEHGEGGGDVLGGGGQPKLLSSVQVKSARAERGRDYASR